MSTNREIEIAALKNLGEAPTGGTALAVELHRLQPHPSERGVAAYEAPRPGRQLGGLLEGDRIMRLNAGRFTDPCRGNGYRVSFGFNRGWMLFGFRPRNWHFYFTKVVARAAFRIYAGPFEIEFYREKP